MFLEENTVEGRRWACSLRCELGSWEAVHADRRYLEGPGKFLMNHSGVYCGDWPPKGQTCGACGQVNNG